MGHRPAASGRRAVLVMVVGVETYYAADVLVRGANASNLWSTVAFVWLALGVASGVIFGAAGALSTRTGTWIGAVASATLPAVFFAEAAHKSTTSSTDVGWIVLLLAVASVLTVWLLRRADRTMIVRTMLCIAAWTMVGFVAYLPFG